MCCLVAKDFRESARRSLDWQASFSLLLLLFRVFVAAEEERDGISGMTDT